MKYHMKNGEYRMMCDRCGHRFPNTFMLQEVDTNSWVCGPKGYNCYDSHDVFQDPIYVKSTDPVLNIRPFTSFVPECYSDCIVDIAVVDCTTIEVVNETVTIGGGY